MAWEVNLPPSEWFTCDSSESSLTQLGNVLSASDLLAIDTETTGLNNQEDRVLYWSLSWQEGHKIRKACLRSELLWTFDRILAQPRTWALANAKYDMHMIANTTGRVLSGEIHDVAVMHGLLYEDMPHGLKEITYQIFQWTWASFEETFGKVNKRDPRDSLQARMRKAELEDLPRLVDYASNDAFGTLLLHQELKKRLQDRPTLSRFPQHIKTLWDYFRLTEAPFTQVLWSCERLGIQIDQEVLENLKRRVRVAGEKAARDLVREAGYPLNPQSPDQVADYLYTRKGYRKRKLTKGGASGIQKPSVEAETLEEMFVEYRDPVLKKIIECKQLHTLESTFLKGISKRLDRCGRIHTRFNQNEAVTGRLSSKDPNLQNIVHPDNDPFGIRSAFVAGPKMSLSVADYSALEMMLLAEAAMDDKLFSIFDRGLDIHMGNASLVFGYPYEEIAKAKKTDKLVKEGKLPSQEMTDRMKACLRARQFVKVISYGLNYGMKENKLAANLGITIPEAVDLMKKYMGTYPAVQAFFQEVQNDLEEYGCVYSLMGRARSLPEVMSPREVEQWRAGRQAANFVIQGSAAECAKMAMVRLHRSGMAEKTGWMLLSQIHDEIIMEGPSETAEEASRILSECMENPFGDFQERLRVPLKASPTIAHSWQEAK